MVKAKGGLGRGLGALLRNMKKLLKHRAAKKV